MNTKHTQGPWRTGDMFNTVFGPPNGTPCPEVIATVHKGNRANARLIAAAPSLYDAACQAIEALNTGSDSDYVQMRINAKRILAAVIAKAEGK